MSICLDPTHLVTCLLINFPQLLSLVTLLICSLYNLLLFAVPCWFVVVCCMACALPCLALPCPALPCPALPCLALPCLALPCPALPCPALPCPALPCPALSCLAYLPVCFSPTGLFLFVLFIIINKKPVSSCNWVLALFPSTQPDSG